MLQPDRRLLQPRFQPGAAYKNQRRHRLQARQEAHRQTRGHQAKLGESRSDEYGRTQARPRPRPRPRPGPRQQRSHKETTETKDRRRRQDQTATDRPGATPEAGRHRHLPQPDQRRQNLHQDTYPERTTRRARAPQTLTATQAAKETNRRLRHRRLRLRNRQKDPIGNVPAKGRRNRTQ